MSLAETFLRGGTPCTIPSELVEVLSSAQPPYAHWRCVAYYPRRWHRHAIDNKISAPVFFLLFGKQQHIGSTDIDDVVALTEELGTKCDATWHLLYYSVLPEGAIPAETLTYNQGETQRSVSGSDNASADTEATLISSGGGGVGALRSLLRSLPTTLMPRGSLEWYSVATGIAHERMGLLTATVFLGKLVPAVCEVLCRHWRSMPRDVRDAGSRQPHSSPPVIPAIKVFYVVDGFAVEVVDLIQRTDGDSSAWVPQRRGRCNDVPPCSAESTSSMSFSLTELSFITETVHKATQWLCTEGKKKAEVADASVPSITEAGWLTIYPLMASLPVCMYTSLFKEAANVGRSENASLNVDLESLTGIAKFRAERDAAIAQWKKKIGEYTSFTVPEQTCEVLTADASSVVAVAGDACSVNSVASLASPPLGAGAATVAKESYRHVLLLQRPVVPARSINIDNRDGGPPSPQPIGAELHLVHDRGDIRYALEQLANRSNVQFVFEDTVHDDGEVLVQLTPVEGVPFCDLEEYFRTVPASSTALIAGGADFYSGSCCPVVVPRVVYRRPTGNTQKANPIAHAVTELELTSPTPAMVGAAAAALRYVSSELVELTGPMTVSSTATSGVRGAPAPGYTLQVPSVDFSSMTQRQCGWCGRWRETLLRCGGCKTVSYCCKRHQSLDWREGSHKVECALWNHARELQHRVVAPWVLVSSSVWTAVATDREPVSLAKTHGWSCAATLTQFLSDIVAAAGNVRSKVPLPDSGISYIHVVGLDTKCVGDFARALAEDTHLRQALKCLTSETAGSPLQYRILICSDTFTDAQRNTVWAIPRSDKHSMWLTPSTGVLGDAWHCEGGNEATTSSTSAMALLRLSGVRYHTLERHLDPNREGCPQAVLSLGPSSGEGCTYLTAALEVFSIHDVGIIPLRLVDSSFVGATRTRNAFAARVAGSDQCTAALKSRVAALIARAKQTELVDVPGDTAGMSDAPRSPFVIRFNREGVVARVTAETSHLDEASVPMGSTSTYVLTPYLNCFLWDVFPGDCR